MTVITGAVYPILVTEIGQAFFKSKANGSLITVHEKIVGSVLLQQDFQAPGYFHGRPQDVTNLSPKSEKLKALVDARAKLGLKNEMLYASGSGLDPDIRPESAYEQVERIAQERKMKPEVIRNLVEQNVLKRDLGVLGDPRVNVLNLNLRLDEISTL